MQFVDQAGSTAAVTCIELVPTKQTLQQMPSKEGTSMYSNKPPEIVQMLHTTIRYPA